MITKKEEEKLTTLAVKLSTLAETSKHITISEAAKAAAHLLNEARNNVLRTASSKFVPTPATPNGL